MAELAFRDDTVVSRGTGEVHAVTVARCSCGYDAFVVFQIKTQQHLHLQCIGCNESFCPSGEEECHGAA